MANFFVRRIYFRGLLSTSLGMDLQPLRRFRSSDKTSISWEPSQPYISSGRCHLRQSLCFSILHHCPGRSKCFPLARQLLGRPPRRRKKREQPLGSVFPRSHLQAPLSLIIIRLRQRRTSDFSLCAHSSASGLRFQVFSVRLFLEAERHIR